MSLFAPAPRLCSALDPSAQPLLEQLAVGGRLVIPTGPTPREQELIRVRRLNKRQLQQEHLGAVRFVPLVGAEGWPEGDKGKPPETD